MSKKIKIKLLDIIIYSIFIFITILDFIISINNECNIGVSITFFIIGLSSIIFFITDKGEITIDKIIYVFFYLFGYYAPFHQYIDKYVIHNVIAFSDEEYLFANNVIIIFLFLYTFVKRISLKNVRINKIKNDDDFYLNNISLVVLLILTIVCFLSLYFDGLIFSTTEVNENTDGLYITLLRMKRFFPIASLMLYIFSIKKDKIRANKILEKIFLLIVTIVCFIIYFPLNGSIGRYLLFGTYIMIFSTIFEKIKYKSLIVLVTSIGFYFIFPAFNFFKTHTLLEISEFELGGFNTNYIDYDAHQLLMMSIRYVNSQGILYAKNIFTGLLCVIPRSIFVKKLNPSGQMVAEWFNLSFTNVSCPIFAEFYLAGGMPLLITLTCFFAYVIKYIEKKMLVEHMLFKGIYNITLGIILLLMRGALLPAMSIYVCLNIVYTFVYLIGKITIKKNNNLGKI